MKGCLECVPGSALALVLQISRFAGVAPIAFTSNGLRISRPLTIYSFILTTVMSCVVVTGFALDMLTEPKRSVRVRTPSSRIIWIANFTIIILITFVAAYRAPSRLQSTIKSLNLIQNIKLHLHEEKKDNSCEKYKIALVLLLSIKLWFLILCDVYGFVIDTITYGREARTLLMYSFLYYEVFLELLVKFQFTLVALHLLSALKLVNNNLERLTLLDDIQRSNKCHIHLENFGSRNVIKSRLNNFFTKAPPTVSNKSINIVIDSIAADGIKQYFYQEKRTVRQLSNAYGSICNVLRIINDGHGLLLLLIITAFFLQLIITPYYLITGLFTFSEKIFNLLLQITWYLYYLLNMLMIVEPCYQIQKEIEKTQVLVCDLMRHVSSSDPIYEDLDIFWKQLQLDRPAFKPLGMCTLSRPLSVTIIGSVTTYLVIIFQFRTYEASDNT